ncbi:MAG: glycyl-radical enzyme activating protein [Eubacteriaceae bacterium]|nr:glycyl-radical enzyme activating protein [Eubacteriaceae bacterium]
MENQITGRIYDIQRFTVNDGPGIRTEVFLKGCPLSCLWCHSPESQAFHKQLGLFDIRCIGIESCGKCLEVCTAQAFTKGEKVYSESMKKEITRVSVDLEKCTKCFKCVDSCPSKALTVIGDDVTVDEIMDTIRKDEAYYKKSGGGVTISGGEALSQIGFTSALLKACKAEGLHTCLDTTGFAKWETIKQAIPYVDLVLLDLKHMDSRKSMDLVGVPNELILENASKMAKEGVKIQIRVPIIPGINDSEENLRATAQFCARIKDAVTVIQILPYHKFGIVKYQRLNKDYQLDDIETPDDQHMAYCKELIESYGLTVKIH